jgi:hypothetical protein
VSTLSLLLLSSLAEVEPIEATSGSFVSPLGVSKWSGERLRKVAIGVTTAAAGGSTLASGSVDMVSARMKPVRPCGGIEVRDKKQESGRQSERCQEVSWLIAFNATRPEPKMDLRSRDHPVDLIRRIYVLSFLFSPISSTFHHTGIPLAAPTPSYQEHTVTPSVNLLVMSERTATVERKTSETQITCTLALDNQPGVNAQEIDVHTGIGFLDHVGVVYSTFRRLQHSQWNPSSQSWLLAPCNWA